MALPVILVDSATGSDTAASGAGPSTALTGSAASTDGAGTVVTLDGSPDLSGVATDGSHVIYLADTTAGARNFGKITAKDSTAKTVTVANAFGLSLSGKSWAIGGVRASVFGGTSLKLTNNNSASGDAMPGWIIQMASGHTETVSAKSQLYRNGTAIDGPITIQGVSGYATRPILTYSSNDDGLAMATNLEKWAFKRFQMKNSNATKDASTCIAGYQCYSMYFEDMIFGDDTNYWWQYRAGNTESMPDWVFVRCTFNKTPSGKALFSGNYLGNVRFYGCMFKNSGSHGCYQTDVFSSPGQGCFYDCQFLNNAGYGYYDPNDYNVRLLLVNCTFEDNASGGVYHNGDVAMQAINCIFSNNGGYGANLFNDDPGSYALQIKFLNCCFYNNTSGAVPSTFNTTDFLVDCITDNPTFVSSTDLTPTNTALQAGLQAAP